MQFSEKLDAWCIQTDMRVDLYQAVKQYRLNSQSDGHWNQLSDEQKRYVDKDILNRERDGLGLPEDKRQIVAQLMKEITDLERKGKQNINEDKSKIEVAIADLDGLSQD